jgi:hypothetical protein
MDVPICQICKDPIWSFICPDCLAKDIGKWLPRNLRGAFGRFSRGLLSNFSSTIDMDGLRCLRCRRVRVANICPFCYLAEVYDWLRERGSTLAETIYRMLPLAGDWRLDRDGGCAWNSGPVPITESEIEQRDEGMCEACERYSDELLLFDGKWICRDCETIER